MFFALLATGEDSATGRSNKPQIWRNYLVTDDELLLPDDVARRSYVELDVVRLVQRRYCGGAAECDAVVDVHVATRPRCPGAIVHNTVSVVPQPATS